MSAVKQNEVPCHSIDGEYIKEWLLLGPLFPDDLETDFLADVGGEANVGPREGDTVTAADGRNLVWKRHKSKRGVIDLLDAVGDHEHATAYAFCVLESETAGDAEVLLGSDDGVAVWINGERVHSNYIDRSLSLDEDDFEVDLRANVNRCLVKVYNVTERWGFAMRMRLLSPDRAVMSGSITDEKGNPIPDAHVRLEQDGEDIAQTQTDNSGSYHLSVYPVQGICDFSATSGTLGHWQSGIQLHEQEHRLLNITLKQAISIEGRLLMLDDLTPHVAVPVQAIRNGKVMDTVLSNEGGEYCFINLKPGRYQVRCQVLNGYVYYGEEKAREPESQKAGGSEDGTGPDESISLRVKQGEALKNIDFRFAPIKKGTWKNYDTLDGLAYNAITKIYRDPDGVMWFATEGGGVSRYDGKEFVNLTTKDGLGHNLVNDIYCDPDGVMWFATNGGVSRYDGVEFVNFTAKDGLAGGVVWDIYGDSDGVMWFVAYGGGVSRYDGKEFVNFTAKDGLAEDFVLSVHGDMDGNIWFGTWDRGVSRYDGKTFVSFTTEDGLANNHVSVIYCDPDGVMWLGTGHWARKEAGGVSRYDGKEFVNFTTKDGLAGGIVWDIYGDPDGVMWFGTEGGVSRYDGRDMGDFPHFVNFTTADGLLNNQVHAIHRDPDGVMWFGTGHTREFERGGVSRYDESTFADLSIEDGLVNNSIVGIHRDADGVMWFGAFGGGVSRYDGKEFLNFTPEHGLLDDRILVIHGESGGAMWFGGYRGASRYDGRELVNFPGKESFAGRGVLAIYRDPDGVMWFGTQGGGVSWYNGEEFISLGGELAGKRVAAIRRDPDGAMWFGIDGRYEEGGLYRYDGKKFIRFTTEDGLADDTVMSIHCDPEGFLWLGTWGGVSRYDGKIFVNFTAKDGLAHDRILAIHRDPDGAMWFGTDGGGAYCYDGMAWTSLDTRDGLAGETVSSIHQDLDGVLWFGTDGGITLYRPSAALPKAHIVSVTTDQIYRDLSAIPAFTPGTRVTVEYNSIDLKTVPEKRQYRCRVYEAKVNKPAPSYLPPTKETSFDWIPEKPGTYIFEVQAIDRDLNYSESAALTLTVQPDPALVSMQAELNYLRREVGGKYHFENIIGGSTGIRQIRVLMERAIDSGLTVLITGETGTGKELVAKAIHYSSPRKDRPLLDRNCGAIPKELLASDLFGHRKGAFTGANEDKMGLFEAASGGTVLLDEISEMPEDAQVHLLRVLEERKVQRLGEHVSRDIDVRIIAMTNRDLIKEVEAGRFREDLYYRLSEFPIHIPPLRERSEDIPLLADHFLQEIDRELAGFAPEVIGMLQGYPWPGNVRELRNEIRRAAALAEEFGQIQTYHFASRITRGESLIQEAISENTSYSEAVDSFRRRFVVQILKECNWNRHEAARRLRMHRSNLIALIRRLGIENEEM